MCAHLLVASKAAAVTTLIAGRVDPCVRDGLEVI
jgi:hypothetical protein